MREDAGCAERFLCALFATAVKPISDLRLLISGLCALLLALCSVAEAQQSKKVRRIAWLTGSTLSSNTHRIEAFRQGLRDLGYVEGTNILIEWRGADGNPDRQPVLVAELLRLEVDVIVTSGGGPTRAAKETTATIPIVFAQDTDPIGNGFVASLARPGGNITGLSRLAPKLTGKQIDLLKEVVSKLSRVAVFANLTSPSYAQVLIIKETKLAAGALAVKLQYLDVQGPKDFETAFREASKERANAVLWVVSGNIASPHRKTIAELAIRSRLPAIYEQATFVEAGGLMSYGVNFIDLDRRAATYVDKILKGAKPADLPVEQPTKFEFIINLKAAKQIGLTIPPNVLARADKVIK
jgi:putative ABC transport system substrate-binding protein